MSAKKDEKIKVVSDTSFKNSTFENIKNKIKIYKPEAFIIDFHGTITSIKWEDEIVLPFVIENLKEFLSKNWNIIELMSLVDTLQQDSYLQRFKYNRDDAPLIEDDPENTTIVQQSVFNFLIWQIKNRKETDSSLSLQKMVWNEGLTNNKLKTIVFDDVPKAFKDWTQKSIKIYILSSVNKNEISQFLKYTNFGDLSIFIDGYFDSKLGKRLEKKTYMKLAESINLKTNRLVYLTDSGKEAKIANEAGLESILVIRPKNYKIRDFYLTCYSSINSFDQLDLIDNKT